MLFVVILVNWIIIDRSLQCSSANFELPSEDLLFDDNATLVVVPHGNRVARRRKPLSSYFNELNSLNGTVVYGENGTLYHLSAEKLAASLKADYRKEKSPLATVVAPQTAETPPPMRTPTFITLIQPVSDVKVDGRPPAEAEEMAQNRRHQNFSEWTVDDELMQRLEGAGEQLAENESEYGSVVDLSSNKSDVPENPDLSFMNPRWTMELAPPASWTFCEPKCAAPSQAYNAEIAWQNARNDVFSALNAALLIINLGQVRENNFHLDYDPPNILLEEFSGHLPNHTVIRYRTTPERVVRHRISDNGTASTDFSTTVTVRIRTKYFLTKLLWRDIVDETKKFIANDRGAHFYDFQSPNLFQF